MTAPEPERAEVEAPEPAPVVGWAEFPPGEIEPAAGGELVEPALWRYDGTEERCYPFAVGGPVTVAAGAVISHPGPPDEVEGRWTGVTVGEHESSGATLQAPDNAMIERPAEVGAPDEKE